MGSIIKIDCAADLHTYLEEVIFFTKNYLQKYQSAFSIEY